jgi:hypothetical protein
MPRSRPFLPIIAIAALLVAISTGIASAAIPESGAIVRVELELSASNGLKAHLETSEKEIVTLELERKGRRVTYEVKGEVTEAGLKVRFGRLGLIDVAFTPTKTLSETEPSEGCTGEPRTLREGIFTGTIDFTGEREYVRIEGSQAEGSMSVISPWQCPEEGLPPFKGASRLLARKSRSEKGAASLFALSRRCSCLFGAGVHYGKRGGQSIFLGAKSEQREGMKILRESYVTAGVSAFVFDHAAGTATLRPPLPFRGHATFRRRPHARELWRSTIRLPLLGADPLETDGPGFRADLSPEYHFG